jgi:hypothetical protein
MGIFESLMKGDIDAVKREMKEQEFRNMASFAGHFRDAMSKSMRPALVWWIENGGTHEPRCGYLAKGDLLRWSDQEFHGKKVRVPTVRSDMKRQVVDGKIEVKGTELLLWIISRMDENTLNVFTALRRSQNKK